MYETRVSRVTPVESTLYNVVITAFLLALSNIPIQLFCILEDNCYIEEPLIRLWKYNINDDGQNFVSRLLSLYK